jgi:hypothetical protein
MLTAMIDRISEQIQTFFLILEDYQSCSEFHSMNTPVMRALCDRPRESRSW